MDRWPSRIALSMSEFSPRMRGWTSVIY